MANNAIDFVIPFLNPESETWQAEFQRYKQQAGLKSDNRFRDWGTMRYVLRGIFNNCPWFNRIHLVLFDETMIPSWLNTRHPKLNIVFHKDFIPKQFLPTFSSSVIEMFLHNIDGLANNFIYSCDDMLILEPLRNDYFFINNRPVSPLTSTYDTLLPENDEWSIIENNNYRLIRRLLGKTIRCDHPHFHIPLNKTFVQFIWSLLSDAFIDGLSHSKFRNRFENQIWIFDDLQRILKHAITNVNIFNRAQYFYCSNSDFSPFIGKNIICFNDTDYVQNYPQVKNDFINFMESVLPLKSECELC